MLLTRYGDNCLNKSTNFFASQTNPLQLLATRFEIWSLFDFDKWKANKSDIISDQFEKRQQWYWAQTNGNDWNHASLRAGLNIIPVFSTPHHCCHFQNWSDVMLDWFAFLSKSNKDQNLKRIARSCSGFIWDAKNLLDIFRQLPSYNCCRVRCGGGCGYD